MKTWSPYLQCVIVCVPRLFAHRRRVCFVKIEYTLIYSVSLSANDWLVCKGFCVAVGDVLVLMNHE